MSSNFQHITVETIGDVLVIVVKQRQLRDYNLAKALEVEMERAVEESEVKDTILDLAEVIMMTSSALMALLGLRIAVREAAGKLVLCNLQSAVAEALTVSQLLVENRNVESHFRMASDRGSALKMLANDS